MIFKSFDTFQSYLQKFIHTVTERVGTIEASILGGTETVTGLPENLILERKVEWLDTDHITDHLWINGLDSRINNGANELQVGEVIIQSLQDLKAYLVATCSERVDLGDFVFPYNILLVSKRGWRVKRLW